MSDLEIVGADTKKKQRRIDKSRLSTERVIQANKASDSDKGDGPNVSSQVLGVSKAIKSGKLSPKTLTDDIFPKPYKGGKG